MYAIVTIAGQQFKVEKDKKIIVHQLKSEVGDDVTFDKVLLIDKEGSVKVGTPYVKDAVVVAQVLSHLRGDKIKVFKKKRRKGYQVLNGHRQYFTELLVEEISETGVVKKAERPKKTETKAAETEATENVAPKAAKPAAKKAAEGKPAESKPKAATKKPAVKEAAKPAAKKTETKAKPAAKKTDKKK